MARLSQDFIERTQELQGTAAARASARVTAWALRSAAHTGDDHFDSLARRVTSSPTRLAGLMSGDHDPMLLCALAGRRSMQDLAGVAPAGGRPQDPRTVLESLAARRVQEHWELCRTEPEKAKRLEARWAAGRATMRSGYMGAPLAAMEATFGAACSAEREAAQGRLVSTVPPASWNPAGAHAGRLAGYGSARWDRMRAEAVAETETPADWRPRRGNDAGDRPRARFVARGAGRFQQLADSRLSPRMAVSRIAFRYRLKRAMARGPAATRRFLTSVASNPRRAAAAVRARLDPMVVAAAVGPKAIEGMLAGRPVQAPGPLGRLQDELHKRDVARLEEVRALRPDAPAVNVSDSAAQRDALDGGLASDKGMRDASARFVDKVWRGDTRVGGQGAGWSADSALGEQFEQGHVAGSAYDAWRARREAVVEGAGAAQLRQQFGADRWMDVDSAQGAVAEERLRERFDELGGAEAGYRLRREVVVEGNAAAGIERVEALRLERQDLAAARGEAARDRAGGDADWLQGETDRRSGAVPPVAKSQPVGSAPVVPRELAPPVPRSEDAPSDSLPLTEPGESRDQLSPSLRGVPPSAGPVDPSKVPGVSVVIPPEALRDVEVSEGDLPKMTQEAEPPPNGSWKVHGDDLVDRVIPLEDGSYEVKFKPGVVALPEGRAGDAASQTHKRRTDPELVERQNERTGETLELERAAQETLADAVEHGRAPFDVERASWSPTQATEAFSQEPVGGLDGDLLRAKAIREGQGNDLRFATRAQIEEAGGHVRRDEHGREAEGVVVLREVSVSAQPFGKDGKVDAKAEPVDYKLKTPVVMYHVATATDLERGQVPKQAVQPPVPEMTAEDLCEAVGVRTQSVGRKGRSEFQPKAPECDIPSDTISIGADAGESVGERNGRLVGAAVRATVSPNRDENAARLAAPPKGTYSEAADKRKYEQRLVEVLAADRVAGRIGVAYKTSPPVTADERAKFAQMLKSQPARERLGREVDRVGSWVADGAKERLHARGVETVHERAQGAPRGAGDRGGRAEREREEPAHAR